MRTTKSKKTARRSNATKGAVKASTRAKPVTDERKIRLTGKDHNRREGSRFYKNFEALRKFKGKTVGAYLEKHDRDALNGAIKDGFVKVA